jgi:hypothetical protein
MLQHLYLLAALSLLTQPLAAQLPTRPDSVRIVVLSDVAVGDKITRLVVASGEKKRSTFHELAPGGGNAVRFGAPRGGYHVLSSVRVYLAASHTLKEGALRVRAASVAANGGPADDDLLPTPVVLTTANLQHSHKNLVINWPANRVQVPETGFFLVLEGLGSTPDEYVSKVVLPTNPKQPAHYELRRRSQPDSTLRLAEVHAFPMLMGAEPDATGAESWYRDTVTQEWRPSRGAKLVVFLEAVFE